MRLNPDCIRDLLLFVESESTYTNGVEYSQEAPPDILKKYSHDEIIYHISQCELSGFLLDCHIYDCGDTVTISDLTPSAHQFLANIRSDNVWNNVKEVSKKVGSNSLQTLAQIATSVITAIINHHLGFN